MCTRSPWGRVAFASPTDVGYWCLRASPKRTPIVTLELLGFRIHTPRKPSREPWDVPMLPYPNSLRARVLITPPFLMETCRRLGAQHDILCSQSGSASGTRARCRGNTQLARHTKRAQRTPSCSTPYAASWIRIARSRRSLPLLFTKSPRATTALPSSRLTQTHQSPQKQAA